jgi:hypothetical protein
MNYALKTGMEGVVVFLIKFLVWIDEPPNFIIFKIINGATIIGS